jgi:hypothetical protein
LIVLVFLHLAVIFAAVSMSFGSQLLLLSAIRSNRADSVRGVTSSSLRVGSLVPVLYGVGGLLGLAAAWVAGFALLAPWLVISYFAFALLAASGVLLTGPNYERLSSSVATSGDGPLGSETRAIIDGNRFRGAIALDFFLLALIVFTEVVKPFS